MPDKSPQNRLKDVRNRIAAHAKERASQISLVAASKGHSGEEIRALAALGQNDFGENYVKEALSKIEQLKDLDLCWHMIGLVQSNKAKKIAEKFSWIHTLSSIKLAQLLSKYRPESMKPLMCLIQVNMDDEESKNGIEMSEIFDLADQIAGLARLSLCGLMVIPKPQPTYADQLRSFMRARALIDDFWPKIRRQHPQLPAKGLLSMGMSADLEAAIDAGTDMLRIGTDLMGPRPPKKPLSAMNAPKLSHLDEKSQASMVDVGSKDDSQREARAVGQISMQNETLALIQANQISKGSVIDTARIAGIMAAKRTSELIPMCHLLPVSHIQLNFQMCEDHIQCEAKVSVNAKTGVEIEALCAVQIALLTIYDMCKSVDRGMVIGSVRLVEKKGGRSGHFLADH